jgi:peptidoglycan/LPS O-acetylase OafA/YrhL
VLVIVSRFFIFSIREASWGGNRLLFVFVLWATSTAVATGLAMVFYSFIEQPFIRLSRNICSKLGGKKLPPNHPASFVQPSPAAGIAATAS